MVGPGIKVSTYHKSIRTNYLLHTGAMLVIGQAKHSQQNIELIYPNHRKEGREQNGK